MKVKCFGCWEELKEQGAILFSPPSSTSSDNVNTLEKFHICKTCFNPILKFIMGDEAPDYKKGDPTLQDYIQV